MAKPYYEFFCPVKVIAGNAALEHIPFELATLGAKRPLIITDKGVRANGLLNPIEAAFSTTDAVIAYIFDDVLHLIQVLKLFALQQKLIVPINVTRLLLWVEALLLIPLKQLIF